MHYSWTPPLAFEAAYWAASAPINLPFTSLCFGFWFLPAVRSMWPVFSLAFTFVVCLTLASIGKKWNVEWIFGSFVHDACCWAWTCGGICNVLSLISTMIWHRRILYQNPLLSTNSNCYLNWILPSTKAVVGMLLVDQLAAAVAHFTQVSEVSFSFVWLLLIINTCFDWKDATRLIICSS